MTDDMRQPTPRDISSFPAVKVYSPRRTAECAPFFGSPLGPSPNVPCNVSAAKALGSAGAVALIVNRVQTSAYNWLGTRRWASGSILVSWPWSVARKRSSSRCWS